MEFEYTALIILNLVLFLFKYFSILIILITFLIIIF